VVESANIICGEILYAELAYRRKLYVAEQKKKARACLGVHWRRTIFQKTDNQISRYIDSVFLEGKER
jgi:hypothetical protein